MRVKQCDHEYKEKFYRKRIVYVYVLLGLIAAFAFAVFLVWAILHPQSPHFVLDDVTVSEFSVSKPSLLTTDLQATLSTYNPNGKIGIFYDHIYAYASYRNQQVTQKVLLTAKYVRHLDTTSWLTILYGSSVPLNPYLSQSLSEDLMAKTALLNIKMDGCFRRKVGSWISGCYRLNVSCTVFITMTGKLTGAEPPVSDRIVVKLPWCH
ncbi:unnamed protein product [Cochlearia groenlandica]